MFYDTLKMVQRLDGPFTREQATALTEALTSSTADTLATKSDLKELRADVETKIVTVESNLIKWIAGALVINLFGTAGLIITLTKALAL